MKNSKRNQRKQSNPNRKYWIAFGKVIGSLFLGLLFGFITWAASDALNVSVNGTYAASGVASLTGIFAGWRWWDKVADGILQEFLKRILDAI